MLSAFFYTMFGGECGRKLPKFMITVTLNTPLRLAFRPACCLASIFIFLTLAELACEQCMLASRQGIWEACKPFIYLFIYLFLVTTSLATIFSVT